MIAALPLTALLAAGIGEEALARLRRATERPSAYSRRMRTAAMAATALIISIVVSLWLPSYHTVLTVDDDAPMRQAQQWITENVPKRDRLIVDDALWVDLVREGRDRRNVIWSYKVDTVALAASMRTVVAGPGDIPALRNLDGSAASDWQHPVALVAAAATDHAAGDGDAAAARLDQAGHCSSDIPPISARPGWHLAASCWPRRCSANARSAVNVSFTAIHDK